ncbi:DUF2243 domain-containing protein [Azospirillum picis]|uniref:Membrane protein n=1 Tax=Azospirillum picis TaxID=488438 RepID=A0ABU0MMA8_9PROT|nr:DUF2243 domain-containing protein [Azospirillum picis]MBP2301032.1 putative membrane protein [Azospirillum picis]MDQ0534348.1 putative membrane protein [Azospirillum picis]
MPTAGHSSATNGRMTSPLSAADRPRGARRLWLAGGCLGFALGGFFDGILLHQILQWHHLLSGLASPAFADIRVQILADGLFHVLMYLIAVVGLWLLWRGRVALSGTGRRGGHEIAGWALVGFGSWHILDALLSHWLLGIHRIRMDVENRLFWDLLWFAVFGIAVVAVGLWMVRRDRTGPDGGSGNGGSGEAAMPDHRRRTVPLALVTAVLVAGPVAALPPAGGDITALVLFRPGVGPAEALGAVVSVNGRPVWSDPTGQLWAFDLPDGGSTLPLYGRGALLVGNGLLPAGCLNWFRSGQASLAPAPSSATPSVSPAVL